jgi:ATP-binding cassette subfamily C protein LapB
LTAQLLVAAFFSNLLALAPSLFVMQVLRRYLAFGVDATLLTLAAGAVLAVLIESLFRRLRMRMAEGLTTHVDETLALAGYDLLSTARAGAVGMIPLERQRAMVLGADAIRSAYSAGNINTLLDLPFALLFLWVLYLLSPLLAGIAAVITLGIFLAGVLSGRLLRPAVARAALAAPERDVLVRSLVEAGDTVRAFDAAPFLLERWREKLSGMYGLMRGIARRQAGVQSLTQLASAVMTVAIIGVGATLVLAGELDVGMLIGANILAGRALGMVGRVAALSEPFARAAQALRVYQEFSRLPTERQEGTALAEYSGGLVLDDVAFTHPGMPAPLFESLHLRLEPGQVLVVSGGNGSGKTTLARLLTGLIEPGRGRVLVDGVDLRQVAAPWWRRQLVYLPQEPGFVAGSIRDNLLLGRAPDKENRLDEVIGEVGLRSFVDRLPGGLDTPLAEGGRNLSLGVRRRLALARALLVDGKLVVFDEPTEGMDAQGGESIYRLLNRLAEEGRTLVLFSHDPYLLRGATWFLDLDHKPVPRLWNREQIQRERERAGKSRQGGAKP